MQQCYYTVCHHRIESLHREPRHYDDRGAVTRRTPAAGRQALRHRDHAAAACPRDTPYCRRDTALLIAAPRRACPAPRPRNGAPTLAPIRQLILCTREAMIEGTRRRHPRLRIPPTAAGYFLNDLPASLQVYRAAKCNLSRIVVCATDCAVFVVCSRPQIATC